MKVKKTVTYEEGKDLESQNVEYRDIKDIDPAGLLVLIDRLANAHDKAEAAAATSNTNIR